MVLICLVMSLLCFFFYLFSLHVGWQLQILLFISSFKLSAGSHGSRSWIIARKAQWVAEDYACLTLVSIVRLWLTILDPNGGAMLSCLGWFINVFCLTFSNGCGSAPWLHVADSLPFLLIAFLGLRYGNYGQQLLLLESFLLLNFDSAAEQHKGGAIQIGFYFIAFFFLNQDVFGLSLSFNCLFFF